VEHPTHHADVREEVPVFKRKKKKKQDRKLQPQGSLVFGCLGKEIGGSNEIRRVLEAFTSQKKTRGNNSDENAHEAIGRERDGSKKKESNSRARE